MASNDYTAVVGVVQKFGEKPVMETRTINDSEVREFTIKSATSGKLVRVTLWPEYAHVIVEKGMGVFVDGKANVNEGKNGTKFYGITPTTLSLIPVIDKLETERNEPAKAASEQEETLF